MQKIHFVTELRKLSELTYKKKPIILYFFTEWCPPCKFMKQRLQKEVISNGKFILACANCDQSEQLNIQYEIEGVPTVIALTKDQKLTPIDRIAGYDPKVVKEFFQKRYKEWTEQKN